MYIETERDTQVVCRMDSGAYSGTGDIGETDGSGLAWLRLPYGEYVASVSNDSEAFLASAVRLLVDLEPMAATATVVLVCVCVREREREPMAAAATVVLVSFISRCLESSL
jgi:hypothetical protein